MEKVQAIDVIWVWRPGATVSHALYDPFLLTTLCGRPGDQWVESRNGDRCKLCLRKIASPMNKHRIYKFSGFWYGHCGRCGSVTQATTHHRVVRRMMIHVGFRHYLEFQKP